MKQTLKKFYEKIYEWLYRLLSPKHKIGFCGCVTIETQEGSKCAECGKIIKRI